MKGYVTYMITDKIKIEKGLHWLTASFPYDYNPTYGDKFHFTMPGNSVFDTIKEGKPTRYYKRTDELRCGATLQYSDDTPDVKPHMLLNMPGSALDHMHNYAEKFTDDHLISWVILNAKNVSRIDFAVDIIGGGNTYQFLYGCQSGDIKAQGKIEEYDAITGERGHTVYVGSKDSELRLRVYDKAAEMKQFADVWTRIELQARGDYALALARDMNNMGVATGGTNRINKKVKAPHLDWWKLAIDSEGKPSSGYNSDGSNWRKWVKDTVLPSLLDHADTDEDIIAQVIYALQAKLLGN